MTFPCDLDPALQDFSGVVPLFPLPNVVLFPDALLPLQIFEPRYRQMTADVLEGEQLIAMSLMCPGWEKLNSNTVPPVHEIMGLGKIISHEKLDDGRYYLLLRGLARVRLVREQVVDLPYRIGELEICAEIVDEPPAFRRHELAEELATLFVQLFPGVNLQQLFFQAVSDLPLGKVCDVLLGALPLATELSQKCLEELNVDRRSQMLLELLKQAVADPAASPEAKSLRRSFPPDFSTN